MERTLKDIEAGIIKLFDNNENKNSIEIKYLIGSFLFSFYVRYKEKISESIDYILQKKKEEYNKIFPKPEAKKEFERFSKLSDWKKVLTIISERLPENIKKEGFGVSNLNSMQQFYRKYRNSTEYLNQAFKLDWSHIKELIRESLEEDERLYYLNRAVKEKWTVNDIRKNIKDETYDKFLQQIEDINYKFNIQKVKIHNYKSLVDLEITPKSKLLVFAGANATGKSNIFESLEFLMHSTITSGSFVFNIFEGEDKVLNFNAQKQEESKLAILITLTFEGLNEETEFGLSYDIQSKKLIKQQTTIPKLDERIVESFSRIFIDNVKRAENKIKLHNKLWIDASNLSRILNEVFKDINKRNEIIEWLQILIPEIEKIEVEQDISGKEELRVFEKSYPDQPITGKLISEGTLNIIALLAICYQSDIPQFICIEEPETGLNPAILGELVPFFREMTKKYNHHVWMTTHSTSLVAELNEEELIIAEKKDGKTIIHQCEPGDFEEMPADEAWMSNMLKGGGIPW
jgi:predicted ATPase